MPTQSCMGGVSAPTDSYNVSGIYNHRINFGVPEQSQVIQVKKSFTMFLFRRKKSTDPVVHLNGTTLETKPYTDLQVGHMKP